MINANELRIGNWVGHPHSDKPMKVFETSNTCICVGLDKIEDALSPHQVTSISLTPEFLEKSGWKKHLDKNSSYYFLNGLRYNTISKILSIIRSCDKAGESQRGYCGKSLGDSIEVSSLHQLQNLYFALTGEELKIML